MALAGSSTLNAKQQQVYHQQHFHHQSNGAKESPLQLPVKSTAQMAHVATPKKTVAFPLVALPLPNHSAVTQASVPPVQQNVQVYTGQPSKQKLLKPPHLLVKQKHHQV
jgi:hypothetical protein